MGEQYRGGEPSRGDGIQQRDSARVEWKDDPKLPERKRAMLERAREFGVEMQTNVMLEMIEATDWFVHPGNVFLPPSEDEIKAVSAQSTRSQERREKDARNGLWDEARRQWRTFDPPGHAPSDWLRAMGTFAASVKPEGAPSVFDVRPPALEETSAPWEQFSDWCRTRHLNPRTLSRVAHRLRQLPSVGAAMPDQIAEGLRTFSPAVMDQVIMAGYDMEDVRVNHLGEYKPIADVIYELDNEKQNEAFEAASAARLQAMQDVYGRSARWDAHWRRWMVSQEWMFDHKRYEAERAGDVAFEAKMEEVHPRRPGLEIARASANAPGVSVTALIARRSRAPDGKIYGHGVHPIDSKIVKALVGAEHVKEKQFPPNFSFERGGVFQTTQYSLVSEIGPVLEQEAIEAPKTTESVRVFAGALAEEKYTFRLEDAISFVGVNRERLKEEIPQWEARSKGRLVSKDTFDLAQWYVKKLQAFGNITTVAEAQAHAAELTLQVRDVFLGQEEVVAQVEREYPASVQVLGKDYPLEYHYVSKEKSQSTLAAEGLRVYLHIGRDEVQHFLTWSRETRLQVGPPDDRAPVEFTVASAVLPSQMWVGKGEHQRRLETVNESNDVLFLQEQIAAKELYDAWMDYPKRNLEQVVNVDISQPFPDATIFLQEPLQPYGKMPNGEPAYPTPVVKHHYDGTFSLVLVPFQVEALFTKREAEEAREDAYEKAKRFEGADKEEIARLQSRFDTLLGAEEACRGASDLFYRRFFHAFDTPRRDGLLALKDGRIEEARRNLEEAERAFDTHVKGKMDAWRKAQELFREYEQLNPESGRFLTTPRSREYISEMLDVEAWRKADQQEIRDSGRWDSRPSKPLPDVEAIVVQLEEAIADKKKRDAEYKAWREERDKAITDFDALSAPEQIEKIRVLNESLEQTVDRALRILSSVARQDLPKQRWFFVNDTVSKLRNEHELHLLSYKREVDRRKSLLASSASTEEKQKELLSGLSGYYVVGQLKESIENVNGREQRIRHDMNGYKISPSEVVQREDTYK